MWSRVVEVMLGCWLLVSPFVFAHSGEHVAWWIVDFVAGCAVIACGLMSYAQSLRFAHLVTIATALGLIGFAAAHALALPADATAIPPALQNHVVLGLLLVMLAVIPNHASDPPPSWTSSGLPAM
jgi:hypothetical protein